MAEPKFRRDRPRRARQRERAKVYKAIGRRRLAQLIERGSLIPAPKYPLKEAA